MDITELSQKTKEELSKLLDEKKREVQELRMQITSGKIKSAKSLKESKKDIARIFTLLNQEKDSKK